MSWFAQVDFPSLYKGGTPATAGKGGLSYTTRLARQTEGIECRKDRGVLDEIPQAYKDIDLVMANQQDLVEVVHTLRQVLCVKG